MNFIDFTKHFPTEESCREEFKRVREQEGVICKKCQCKAHYWLKSKALYECKACGFRMSLKSGTVMENSKLPYQYWLLAMHLITASKKTLSALELQAQLGHKYYEPIWAMMHKIRLVMAKRDEQYQLTGDLEIDEGYYSRGFTLEINEFTGEQERLKRGKGSQRKTTVLVMVSHKKAPSKLRQSRKYTTDKIPRFIKMKVIDDLSSTTIQKEVSSQVSPDASVETDKLKSYKKLPQIIKKHIEYDMSKFEAGKVLPWVHKAITNSKNLIKAIHHCVWQQYLQNYLSEFCFKYNRRAFGEKVFDRLMIAAVSNQWF